MIPAKEVLQSRGGYDYIVEAITKEQHDEIYTALSEIKSMRMNSERIEKVTTFQKLYNFHPEHIIAIGDDSGVTNHFLKDLIPFYGKKGYHCYVKPQLTEHLQLHEDALSSWNCVMNKMYNPKFTMIYKKQR